MKKRIVYLLLGIILIVGLLLRNHNLNVWPREGATFDEYAWTFLGLSIWENGTPVSWSPHKAYENRVHYVNPKGATFFLVTPYLEHPPLFGIVAGGFGRLMGLKSFDDVEIIKIRGLSLILGYAAILSVFALASSVFGFPIGLLSAGIYAIFPTVVVGSRLVQNENFFIPLFLFVLTGAHEYTKKRRRWLLISTLIICFLLPLAKIPWIAANAAVFSLFLYKKMYRESIWTTVVSILSVGSFFLYGMIMSPTVFLNLWKLQLARYDMTFSSIFRIFTDPLVTDRTFLDGWVYVGWIAMAVLFTVPFKKTFPVVLGFLSYLCMFAFAIPGQPEHGWYRYPFYPFLSIAIAWMVSTFATKNYLLLGLFFLFVILSMLGIAWLPVFGFSYTIYRIVLSLIAVSMFPIIFPTKITNGMSKIAVVLLCIITVALTIYAGLSYNEQ